MRRADPARGSLAEIDPSNAAQAAAWDGSEGRYWADHATRFDQSLAAYRGPFMAAADITDGAHVLDVGCGTGETTRAAATLSPDGAALGIDLSSAMIDVARSVAAADGLRNVSFVHADAQIHPFPAGRFDRVISRTGSMFFADPTAAFTNVARAGRPGARLTLLTWQPADRNEWFGAFADALLGRRPELAPAAPGPFSMSDPRTVRELLHRSGFVDVDVQGVTGPMWYGADVDDAHLFVLGLLGWMLDGRDADARRRAGDALHATLAAHRSDDGVTFESAGWLVTARRA